MADLNRFVFYGDWLNNIAHLPLEEQEKIISDIVRYGVGSEMLHQEEPNIKMAFLFTKGAIDTSKNNYQEKINNGVNYGKKKKLDDAQVYTLAREGKDSSQIAEILGVSKSSVDHSQGWSKRKNDEFLG